MPNVEISPVTLLMISPQKFSQQQEHPQETFAVELLFILFTPGFTPDFHVILHMIWFFMTNEDVTKNNCGSLKNLQESLYDRVYFSKVTNLLCTDCNFYIKRLYHRLLSEYVPKTCYLKIIF